MIDFGETHVFESACVMTNILLFSNENNKYLLNSTQVKDDFTDPSQIGKYVETHSMNCKFEINENWVILPDSIRHIKKKVESKGKILEEWDIEMYRGVTTGLNNAFIIPTSRKEEILSWSHDTICNEENIMMPLLRGKRRSKIWLYLGTKMAYMHLPFKANRYRIISFHKKASSFNRYRKTRTDWEKI